MLLMDDKKERQEKMGSSGLVADSLVAHQRACFIANLDKRNREALQSLGDFGRVKANIMEKIMTFKKVFA